ncbi:hypothetical protein [Psychrobacter faecalis]
MELSLDSNIQDLLKQDLPRTIILKDIHNRIINSLKTMKAPESVIEHNVNFIQNKRLYHFESFYRHWIEEANNPKPLAAKTFPLEILFIYGLLLPYYLDYTQTDFSHFEHFNLPINDSFRAISSIKDTDYPHSYAVHHAHQITNILVNKLDHISKQGFINAQKTANKTKEKRRAFHGAFNESLRLEPIATQKKRAEIVMDLLEKTTPNEEYNLDQVKVWISEYSRGIRHDITWFEIPSIQSELIEYIQSMPKL